MFSGQDYPSPPPSVCTTAPLLCSLAGQMYRQDQGRPPAAGTIKLSVLSGVSHLALNLGFSILLDNSLLFFLITGATHVKPHYGLTNTKLRAHLPLVVPSDPAPLLRVAQVTCDILTPEYDQRWIIRGT